jgi:prevent-host-death family protein
LKIATRAAELGIQVLTPLTEHARYDLAFEIGGRLYRVQCKAAFRRGDVLVVNLVRHRVTTRGHVQRVYSPDEIDAIAAYSDELDECFVLPIDVIAGMRSIYLRLSPALNGQRGAVNMAQDFAFGAIAQLGERSAGSRKVGGSSPPGSTGRATNETVGAHEFREHFGWYMQRASHGERFVITRRGKPFARLLPPTDQLNLTTEERVAA